MIEIKIASVEDAKKIEEAANIVWNEHYTKIIGKKQVDYMLEQYQSELAIIEQMERDYIYCYVNINEEIAGYCSYKFMDNGKVFLSKLYVLDKYRKKGIGRGFIKYIVDEAKEKEGYNKIWLNVNRFNKSVMTYENMGFVVVDKTTTKIGHGFVMDDYIMEAKIEWLK